MKTLVRQIYNKVWETLGFSRKRLPVIQYWEKRAKQYGKRSVFNIGHSKNEMETITKMQKYQIFPLFRKQLTGNENIVIDFGCGTGRFTCDLAQIIDGKAIGLDPIQYLLDLAKEEKCINVEYRTMSEGKIPVASDSADIIWICLVLGGIVDQNVLKDTVLEMQRVLKEKGLIFLVENTTNGNDGDYWKYRSIEFYQSLFDYVDLKHISDYMDMGETISIMAGRS